MNDTKFNIQQLKYLILRMHTVLIVVMEQYDMDLILTLMEIAYKINLLSMIITKLNTEQQSPIINLQQPQSSHEIPPPYLVFPPLAKI